MKASLLAVVLCLAVGCGPDMTGTWTGSINAIGSGGQQGSYSDTWNISDMPGQSGTLQVLSTGTCTKWQATQGGALATWGTACGGYQFSGTMQLTGGGLAVNFSVTYPIGGASVGTGSGTLSKQ